MKTNIKHIALGLLTVTTTFFACRKEEFKPLQPMTPAEQTPIKPKPVSPKYDLVNTTWKVTYFDNAGSVETDYYNRNTFALYSNNLLVVMLEEDAMEKGKWSAVYGLKSSLTLEFPESSFYNNLSGNWRIVKQSDTMLFLETDKKDGVVKMQMEKV
ncbi:MAG: hypothetical protein K0Q95_2463 [Bacteroidota bacterium]|jgi:hypothetical protein|nr:hypothetical protein [Bacteroidota bacterium]